MLLYINYDMIYYQEIRKIYGLVDVPSRKFTRSPECKFLSLSSIRLDPLRWPRGAAAMTSLVAYGMSDDDSEHEVRQSVPCTALSSL